MSRKDAVRVVVESENPDVPLSPEQVMFLVEYMSMGTTSSASKKTGIKVAVHHEWCLVSPNYKKAFEKCHEAFL